MVFGTDFEYSGRGLTEILSPSICLEEVSKTTNTF
jgi:hypothetical protein